MFNNRSVTDMADIVYALDPDAGVTTIVADSPAGDKWLGRHVTTIPNIDFPGYLASAKAVGLRVEALPGQIGAGRASAQGPHINQQRRSH
jgi:hypothetical protein